MIECKTCKKVKPLNYIGKCEECIIKEMYIYDESSTMTEQEWEDLNK